MSDRMKIDRKPRGEPLSKTLKTKRQSDLELAKKAKKDEKDFLEALSSFGKLSYEDNETKIKQAEKAAKKAADIAIAKAIEYAKIKARQERNEKLKKLRVEEKEMEDLFSKKFTLHDRDEMSGGRKSKSGKKSKKSCKKSCKK